MGFYPIIPISHGLKIEVVFCEQNNVPIHPNIKRRNILCILLMACVAMFVVCTPEKSLVEEQAYELEFHNWSDSVEYVGMETCKSCHAEIYETFKETGMGQSWFHATRDKSAATYGDHALIYDSLANLYYKPHWDQDSLYITEFRLDGMDTTHKRLLPIKYIVGSGQHTNSHIIDVNGFLRQAPITFYTQKGIWDLAPGFDSKLSQRVNRIVGLECMSCHNNYPEFEEKSENKFTSVPMGIQCERCHGPGEEHVRRKLSGERVDTSQGPDLSIVNPKRLSKELQMSICRRCHAQGVAILKEGKSFFDFKPGRHLTEVMDVFLPRYDGAQTQFIMASHADRTAMSECYKKSDMTCISCHNPHVSVKATPIATFNQACINCHSSNAQSLCTVQESERISINQNNCSSCHMPESPSIDIPHVTVHDHFIRKPVSALEKSKIENFVGLKCITTNAAVSAKTRARAFLKYHESFQSDPYLLDSVKIQLDQIVDVEEKLEELVHYYYLKSNYGEIRKLLNANAATNFDDAWSFYRVGEAYSQNGDMGAAEKFFDSALELKPLNFDFQNKKAAVLIAKNRLEEADAILSVIIENDPWHFAALSNRGFMFMKMGEAKESKRMLDRALAVNPDYVQGLMNKAAWLFGMSQMDELKRTVERVLQLEPENKKALEMRKLLKES